MNKEQGFIEAEIIAKNAWEEVALDPVALFRGENTQRDVIVNSKETVLFHFLLEQHLEVEKFMLGPTSEGKNELEKLEEIKKTFEKRSVFERDCHGNAGLEKVKITGDQVASIYDFLTTYQYDVDRISETSHLNSTMQFFAQSLVTEYPVSQVVAQNQGKIKGLIHKVTRHGSHGGLE